MDTNDFLSAVLPAQGKYCTFISRGDLRKNIFVDSLDALYDTNIKQSDAGVQTYYALSAFDDAGYRKAENAVAIRALFMDLDCGFEEKNGALVQKAFPSQKAAYQALLAFLKTSGLHALGLPWLVNSGSGIHVYWPLRHDATIAQWKPVAEALKKAAVTLSFPIDATVTSDAARVLRCPGTLNWKTQPPKPVLLRQRGDVFELEDIAETLASYTVAPPAPSTALTLPGTRPTNVLSPVAQALVGNSVTYFKNIMERTNEGTGCAQLQHYVEHAAEDGMEPVWRAWLSIAKHCVDGDKASIKLSRMHPYDPERMAQKLDAIKGPYACTTFDSINPGVCASCPHWGKITNPLALGREIKSTVEPAAYDHVVEGDSVRVDRPTPPWGFSYGEKGGLFYRYVAQKKDEVDHDIMLLPYDFFMTDIYADANERVAEFKAVKPSGVYTLGIPLAKATNQADCIKALAAESIVTSVRNDAYLASFVRQSIISRSAVGDEVQIPPRFGWLEGGDFALCDRVISQHGPQHDYVFKSSRLSNLIEMTRPRGTIEGWRKPFDMMRRKNLWGHLAFATLGFASPLMHFMPAGARAVVALMAGKGSGNGKSYSAAMCNSIWGDPKHYNVPPKTSDNTLMQRAGLLGSLHLGVDEITDKQRNSEREFIPQIVFAYAAGAHKLKGSATGNAEIRNDLFWEGFMSLTGNTPALEAMMGARGTTSEGEARRLLEWAVPENMDMRWSAEDEADAQAVNENYGLAGQLFIEWCVTHQPEVQQVCMDTLALWRRETGAPGTERFWSNGCAASIAACILLKRAGIIDIPASEIMNFWINEVITPARRIIFSNQRSSLDVLLEYIREHSHNFIRVSSNVVISNLAGNNEHVENNRRQVRGRVEQDIAAGTENTYVEIQLLRHHCAQRNVGFSQFLRDLEATGTVTSGRKNLTAGTSGSQLRVPCICLSQRLKVKGK